METMHAAGRRTLPPVPRAGGARPAVAPVTAAAAADDESSDTPTERFLVDLTTGEQGATPSADALEATADAAPDDGAVVPGAVVPDAVVPDSVVPDAPVQEAVVPDAPVREAAVPDAPVSDASHLDAAQQFVARLRAAAPDFAVAAGAASAVVREAVPPARHRRARCRVVLRYADGPEAEVTFLGTAGRPGGPSRHGFDRQIRRWLGAGRPREDAWIVADPDVPGGEAVDLSAWAAGA